MKLLYLVSNNAHPHAYGEDYILDGLRELLGPENVYDWPEKWCLHLKPGELRDECNIDSDQWWPSRGAIPIEDLATTCDLAIIACQPDDPEGIERIRHVCGSLPPSMPIACVDMTDHVRDLGGFYTEVAGRPLVAYFKRELPIGADWGHPCPLTYPASRVPDPMPVKVPRVAYFATHHGGGAPGVPRLRIVADLRKLLNPSRLDVALYPSQQNRPSPEEYRAKLAKGLVGIHWNGAVNWDSNRHWENFAFALCQVAEKPRIQIPNPFEHMRHCYYVEHAEKVADVVAMLLRQPSWALSIAEAGHRHFMKYHCSKARAAYVLEKIKENA